MGYSSYQINLPESPEAVAFVNGFLARNLSGLLWMWKNVFWIRNATTDAEGCVQVKAGICGPKEVVMVSYWQSEDSIKNFFRGKPHRQMMHYIAQHSESLCLYNETYRPDRSGKYIHEPQGLAIIYPRAAEAKLAQLRSAHAVLGGDTP